MSYWIAFMILKRPANQPSNADQKTEDIDQKWPESTHIHIQPHKPSWLPTAYLRRPGDPETSASWLVSQSQRRRALRGKASKARQFFCLRGDRIAQPKPFWWPKMEEFSWGFHSFPMVYTCFRGQFTIQTMSSWEKILDIMKRNNMNLLLKSFLFKTWPEDLLNLLPIPPPSHTFPLRWVTSVGSPLWSVRRAGT